MEAFYIAVLTIAAVVLIIILTTVGVAIRKANREIKWPPTGGRCPDGWEEDAMIPGKCYMRSDMINSGNVTPESSGSLGVTVANGEKGYAFANDRDAFLVGDKWRECGSIVSIGSDNKTLNADGKSNFNYFNAGDSIKVGPFSERVISEKKSPTILILRDELSQTTSFPVKYYGKRISVDFNKSGVYVGASDSLSICLRKDWANLNKIEWDGVSNYNKCG
jgi:hypothetical protein